MKMRVKLSATARKLRQDFLDHWEVADPAGIAMLEEMCACFDRLQAAKRLLSKHGQTVTDRFGQEKVSPWFLMVRDETQTFLRLSKALNLEVEDLDNRPGRPDGFQPEVS
jgi:phage terminase small subunit